MILVLLREIRADMAAMEERMNARFDRVEMRFEEMEKRLDKLHANGFKALQGFIGHRAMVERTMASFEDEIARRRRRVERLEAAEACVSP
jgi:ribosomal protein L15E